jgi:hypothetical protein
VLRDLGAEIPAPPAEFVGPYSRGGKPRMIAGAVATAGHRECVIPSRHVASKVPFGIDQLALERSDINVSGHTA